MFAWKEGELDPEQESAIRCDGNVFLVACPGSGKTRTLTYKIAYELSRLSSEKQRVIAITYTHRAADEIHERIEALGVDTAQLWIGTIHSFCLEWILKPYGIYHAELSRGFRVINSHDSERILTELCEPYKREKIKPFDCGFYYTADGCVLACANTPKQSRVEMILQSYFQILSKNRQIDFELMLYYAHQLIADHPTISVLLSKMFAFVMVDEYQDTKAIQYSIIASILRAGAGSTKAFIVGDPNQAIFQGLGGFPIAAYVFAENAQVHLTELMLWRNYRSSEKIVGYFSNFNVHATQIESRAKHREYASIISFNNEVHRDALDDELIRLIRFNIEVAGIPPREICILAPQWVSLAAMTRKLVSSLPEYEFDGPGMVPFARDIDNFWYKFSRIVLTTASPEMFIRRRRWAAEILKDLEDADVTITGLTHKSLLRQCNSIKLDETDGLKYLAEFFGLLFAELGIDIQANELLKEHHEAFFGSSQSRIDRLRKEGAEFVGEISNFRKVFSNRSGITISTIHGIKGDEYDAVIAYALLEGMVPNSNDSDGENSAKKLLYVICSRARKNLHLISERGRLDWRKNEYGTTLKLAEYDFGYDTLPTSDEAPPPL